MDSFNTFDMQPVSDDCLRIRWHGDLTPRHPASKAESLFMALERKRAGDGSWTRVQMDLSQAAVVDSRGIAMLLLLRRNLVRRDIEFSVEGAPALMGKMLHLANLDRVIPIAGRMDVARTLISADDLQASETSADEIAANDSLDDSGHEATHLQAISGRAAVVIDPFEDAGEIGDTSPEEMDTTMGGTSSPFNVSQEAGQVPVVSSEAERNTEPNRVGETR
ncbi:MAG: STAS domain-containing protein [Planctomycetota bacterium]